MAGFSVYIALGATFRGMTYLKERFGMSIRNSIAEEIQKSPVATISASIGVLVAVLSLALAWFQYQAGIPPSTQPESGVGQPPTDFVLGRLLLVIAYFLAVTVTAAVLLRAIARKHDVAAFFTSIPLLALTNFSTIVILFLTPPRPLSIQLFTSAHDLVFYASAAIVMSMCGAAVLADIARPSKAGTNKSEEKSSKDGEDGLAIIFVSLLILAIWSWLVFAGQTRLTRTLLPEITHPAEVKAVKSGA